MTTDEDLQKEIKELTKKSRELYLAAERQITAAQVAIIRLL